LERGLPVSDDERLSRFRRTAAGPRVFGHRGASARAPENTLAAFSLALDEGADGVELDVCRCASGEVVVLHDPTLARTTGDPRAVRDVSFAELRRLDAGAGEQIPLLDEALELVVGRDGVVNVEVKADDDDRSLIARCVARTLGRRSARERASIVISSFDPRLLLALRAHGVGVPFLFLFADTSQGRILARTMPPLLCAAGVNPEYTLLTEARVRSWRARGLLVSAWTVNGAPLAQYLARLGVDALITDDPRGTRAALGDAIGA
jgi:glycerophosphoryl diester phosphodiesterase